MIFRVLRIACFLALSLSGAARAQSASFDLVGPALKATVTRGAVTLPIGQVPQLAPGDRLHVSTDLPADQLRKNIIVVAFLRGATNPPPKEWFFRIRPDKRKPGGSTVLVPQGAQQALVLLAPNVSGGFGGLVSAVRGRPGVFVRASQDMRQASLDRTRLEAFLDEVSAVQASGAERLDAASAVLARSLAIRWNAECLQRLPSLQAACLTHNKEALVLHDGRGRTSLTETLTGAPADIAYRISATPQGGSGYYNPYIGLVRDVARLLGSFGTAQYQYIPALALGRDEELRLLLNTAPSFRKPQSVIVAPLPPVEGPELPTIRSSDPFAITCLARDALLAIEGAPLLYATDFARNMTLRFTTKGGNTIELPVEADARRGGLVVQTSELKGDALDPVIDATLHGHWGFEPFAGPSFRLQGALLTSWRAPERAALVVGRGNELKLDGGAAACVETVSLGSDPKSARPVKWKTTGPQSLSLTLPLQKARAGSAFLYVSPIGRDAVRVPLKLFEEASRIEAFILHAGDQSGVLKGARLDQVAELKLAGTRFTPGDLERVGPADLLTMTSDAAGSPDSHAPGQQIIARVELKDGRTLSLPVTITTPRPRVALAQKNVEPDAAAAPIALSLLGDDAVPQGATIAFSVRAEGGTEFRGREAVEIATADGSSTATVKIGAGLIMVDPQTLVARTDVSGALGKSAFGPLRFRVVQEGGSGDWQPLATLVRLPRLSSVTCTEIASGCTLAGSDLFLIDSIASDAEFTDAVQIPHGYTGTTVAGPRKRSGHLFIRLRDAPQVPVRIRVPD